MSVKHTRNLCPETHQNAFGGRVPPGPVRGAYSAPPDPLAELRGKREGRGVGKGERGREGEKEAERRKGQVRDV